MSVNPVILQKALRDNANDLQDFCKDLQNWGEDMKRKEEALRGEANQPMSTNKIRKTHKSAKKVSVIETSKKPISKFTSTDYAAWDKFDVDAELNKLEEDIQDDSDLTDECNDNIFDEAIVEKEKGNKFVKCQKWNEAVKCYTKAIECYSYDPIFYANRALCYLKLSKFEEAERDCELSLKLDPTYVKAYQRRAAARTSLNKLEHAESDLLRVIELEPKNKESLGELNKLRQKLKQKVEKPPEQRPISKFTASRNPQGATAKSNFSQYDIFPKEVPSDTKKVDNKPISFWRTDDNVIEVKPIQKAPHLRSTKPLKRIKIKEEDEIILEEKSDTTIENTRIEEPVKKHVFEKQEMKIVEDVERPTSAFKQQKDEQAVEKNKKIGDTSWPKPENQSLHINSDDFRIIERKEASITKDVKNTVNDSKKSAETLFVSPKSSVQFYSTWKDFKNTHDKYLYLKYINPKDLPKIFLNTLDSNIFSNILAVMAEYFVENKDSVFDILNHFTEVKRFSAITMFLSSEDKNNLWKLFDYIKENEDRTNDKVDELIQKFEL
ncbi:unnamed protein product [Phaedon cochleariae]|uniref:RNA polymerase II-associated protein 3 n=1 Tax=Phaedon cochleariae TaxID=80249 RepID=A0A9P0GUH3_PHACE|nr:unnamed protein product [Phaedon cochleariae]